MIEKGLREIGIGVSSGSSSKAGGELHGALLFKAKEWLEEQGYFVKIPEQGGRYEQPDMLAYPKGEFSREIAVEIETLANHPEQIVKNYEKNVRLGRFVIFIVANEEVKRRIRNSLKDIGKRYLIYKLKNYQE